MKDWIHVHVSQAVSLLPGRRLIIYVVICIVTLEHYLKKANYVKLYWQYSNAFLQLEIFFLSILLYLSLTIHS